jgi:hypothetical protein
MLKKRIIRFGLLVCVLSWPTIYLSLTYATYTFFKNYPAELSAQDEAIGIVLSEIAPWGCLALNVLVLALCLIYPGKLTREEKRQITVETLSAAPGTTDLLSEFLLAENGDFS